MNWSITCFLSCFSSELQTTIRPCLCCKQSGITCAWCSQYSCSGLHTNVINVIAAAQKEPHLYKAEKHVHFSHTFSSLAVDSRHTGSVYHVGAEETSTSCACSLMQLFLLRLFRRVRAATWRSTKRPMKTPPRWPLCTTWPRRNTMYRHLSQWFSVRPSALVESLPVNTQMWKTTLEY